YCIPVENMALVANSISSVVAAAWVLDYAPRIRAMVLAAPAFRVRLYVPFAVPGLRILQKFAGRRFVSSYVKARLLTHDRQEIDSYNADELISRRIGTHMLLGLHDLSTRVMQDAGAIVTPTLVLAAGSDFVVSNSAIRRFYNRLSSPTKDLELYPGFFHAILYEAKRADALAKSRGFIEERFASNVDRSPLLAGDDAGYTKEEYQRLRVTAHPIKALGFTSLKLAIRTIGRLSDGIRLGWRTGFDSGESLDYVYRNEARGTTAIGRQIDRAYLNSVGWRAMRARQANLSAILEDTIRRVAASGRDVRIFDTAAGGGRYVLQALQATGDLNVSATLLDKDPAAVAAGEAHADSLGIESVCFAIGDAFDAATLRALSTMPNIIVASGFYELFPDNRRVSLSLSALAELLDPDGYLIYTGMPWHPQLEMIARTCVNRDGEAWIMRRRSTAELDELVRSVGLEKTDTRIDPWGVSTVSIARKRRNNL
ncbi:MAG: class I SAM-dependent methyltransferase family protein, partial [Woeseiaceae bacterium]|nr:class I SAM-dependent methyltransferase family protein [Woeseiaceae bacterium]